MLEQLTREMFEQQTETTFKVTVNADQLDFKLTSVRQLKTGADAFSLVFEGPASPRLSQQIYHFDHNVLGTFDLFIVPIGLSTAGIRYEAVINRLQK